MSKSKTLQKEQVEAATAVLEQLRTNLAPEFLGLISTDGHLISVVASSALTDSDSIASLAASSFAATRQLARVMNDAEFTVMFHEGNELNVHIAQAADDVLLVICFHKATQIGKVRLVSSRAHEALKRALSSPGAEEPDVDMESITSPVVKPAESEGG